ncbi:hypothetical protein L3H44_11095, partial [Corynebacterium sp. MC-12]
MVELEGILPHTHSTLFQVHKLYQLCFPKLKREKPIKESQFELLPKHHITNPLLTLSLVIPYLSYPFELVGYQLRLFIRPNTYDIQDFVE